MGKGRLVKRALGAGLVAGAAYAVWRWYESHRSESGMEWEAQPFPYPPTPKQPEADDDRIDWPAEEGSEPGD